MNIKIKKIILELRYEKALITGITGMVGSHLADFLIENTIGILLAWLDGEVL